jgi:ferredoxin
MFSLPIAPVDRDAPDLQIDGATALAVPRRFTIARPEQWAVCADACNACGHCDTHCPEHGGPFRVKPRFHASLESFEAAAPEDGLVLLERGALTLARFDGDRYECRQVAEGFRFSDGVAEALLDRHGRWTQVRTTVPAHVLPLRHYHAMRALRDAAMTRVSFAWVPEGAT